MDHVSDGPGEGVLECGKNVHKSPGDDDVVIESDTEGGKNGSETDTGKARVHTSEHTNISLLEDLSEGELKHEHGDTEEEEAEKIGDEEKSTTPLVAEIGESPEVTETDS